MSRRVAFLGTGLMGAPMARRLLTAGHEVTVWNRTRPKSEALADAGAAVDFDTERVRIPQDLVESPGRGRRAGAP